MFPIDIVTPITIYPTYTDKITGNQINIRCVLEGCFWNESSISIFTRTGQQTQKNVILYIPYDETITGKKYITPEEWNNSSYEDIKDNYWTINPNLLPIMLKGISEFEFDWSNRLRNDETTFLNNNPTAKRVSDVNVQTFGSDGMKHIVVRS